MADGAFLAFDGKGTAQTETNLNQAFGANLGGSIGAAPSTATFSWSTVALCVVAVLAVVYLVRR